MAALDRTGPLGQLGVAMAEIFISYARQDKARAAQFVELLESFGWDVFWDQETRAGTIWPKVLEDELGLARCLMVLWTANSVASRWVRIEAYEALQGDKLLPVRLENVKPPLEFRQTQTFDLLGWAGERDDPRLDHLVADLCALARLEPRKGSIGPATLNAVRTLVPSTLGVSSWQAPEIAPGAPDFSGHHAPTYQSVDLAVATLAPHAQESYRADGNARADTLPYLGTQARKSESAAPAPTGLDTPGSETRAESAVRESTTIDAHSTATDRKRRQLAWGVGLAVLAVTGVWIAKSMLGPGEIANKDEFKSQPTANAPAANSSSATVAEPAPTIVTAPPPAATTSPTTSSPVTAAPGVSAKPSVSAAAPTTSIVRPHAPSSRCIEITERFQQTGQLTAEERQFLKSKECAR